MALHHIWKQQLALVSYGNAYLSKGISFAEWRDHSIFNQSHFEFRDLISQQLLAQHFQVWLEGLKKNGTHRLSLHSSQLLIKEKNPNPNVELLEYPHFIVSHSIKSKHAWICGKELALWDTSEQEFTFPKAQTSDIQQETFWRFELHKELIKQIEHDLANPPQWQEIQSFLNLELFEHDLAKDLVNPEQLDQPYTGLTSNIEGALPLIPSKITSQVIHQNLYRFDALHDFFQYKIQHPYDTDGNVLSPIEQQNLRTLSKKAKDLHIKFIVKVANHYQSAPQLTPSTTSDPLEISSDLAPSTDSTVPHKKVGAGHVFKLILGAIIICAVAYYLGL